MIAKMKQLQDAMLQKQDFSLMWVWENAQLQIVNNVETTELYAQLV